MYVEKAVIIFKGRFNKTKTSSIGAVNGC